jgi:uncharacterized membrane protein YraQ (UPF0718 family)
MDVLGWIGDGLWNAFRMAWEVGWALILGFAFSGIVQAWIPRSRMQSALGARDLRTVSLATGLGAASSSCSYAAVAIAKSMLQKGASLVSAMAFQFASTNLVFELGIVIWIFLGWEFTLAELVGGVLLIAFMWAGLRLFVTRSLEEEARRNALEAQTGHEHHSVASKGLTWRRRLTSVDAWSDVAYNFRGDWEMLWKEIGAGFLIAGFIALLPMSFFNALFLTDAPAWIRIPENVIVGPLVAILSFVCSIGNVPLAAVLWAGGISFSGVIAFIYADLIIIPLVLIYRYYGTRIAVLFSSIMLGSDGVDPVRRPDVDSTERASAELPLPEHRLPRSRGGPDRADDAGRHARPGVRDDRQPQDRAAERVERDHVLLLRPGLQGAVRGRSRALPGLVTQARARAPALGSAEPAGERVSQRGCGGVGRLVDGCGPGDVASGRSGRRQLDGARSQRCGCRRDASSLGRFRGSLGGRRGRGGRVVRCASVRRRWSCPDRSAG